jgi:arylsulfatase A-like enzyme
MLHGWVYCEVARVPLVVRFPDGRWSGTRVRDLVQLVDVVPTVLGSLGADRRAEMSGHDLADLIGGSAGAGTAFIEGEDAYAVRTERRMHLLDIEDGHRETYDIVADPGEREDLTGRHPDEEKALEATLLGWINVVEAGALRGSSGEPVKVDRKTRELLKSLGYLQTGE